MEKIRKILVIRFRRVGDSVISTVLCSTLKRTFPDAKIHYVLNDNIAPLFEHHPDIDQIISFSAQDMESFSTYISKVKTIVSDEKFDMIIDTRSTIKTLWFSLFSMKTPYRIGKKKSYNLILHNYRTNNEGVVDEVTKMLKLLTPLEKKFNLKYERHFKLYVTPEEKEYFAQYMQKQGIDFSKPVIVCAVTARLIHKVWNQKRMKETLQKIVDNYDVQLIFNYGGKDEKDFAINMYNEMLNNSKVFINIEARNLRELAAMFANADFFFGNEGGPRHISQAFDVPSLAIFPPQISKEEWLPNASDRFQGIEPADISDKAFNKDLSFTEKFDLITVDAVWNKLEAMLEKYLNKIRKVL